MGNRRKNSNKTNWATVSFITIILEYELLVICNTTNQDNIKNSKKRKVGVLKRSRSIEILKSD